MERVREFIGGFGLPRLIITGFLLAIILVAFITGMDVPGLVGDSLVRIGMNGLFVLAMIPTIQTGVGLNFGLPVGIICGIVGCLIAMEFALQGFAGFLTAVAIAIPLAVLAGFVYSLLLNRVTGQEMMVGTYVGFSIVAGMCIFWLTAPFSNPSMIWAIGGSGLRTTLTLEETFAHVLNDLWQFTIFGVTVPTGLLLFFGLWCFLLWIFFRTKTGMAMEIVGRNPRFARASGLNINFHRSIGVILSTVLGAVGYVVYAQSFGFVQLYLAPLMMAFPAVAGILIGGASTREASVVHAIIGVTLFQSLLTVAMPVTNQLIEGNISEIARVIVSNGMILYALTRTTGGEKA